MIEIRGRLDRAAAEMLQLELRRLADRHGVEIIRVGIERTTEG